MVTLVPLSSTPKVNPNVGQTKVVPQKLKLVPLFEKPIGAVSDAGSMPEITSQKTVPWTERIGTDFKLLATSEPWEKARIIQTSFPDRVELFQDTETKEPVIALDGTHFVVNKKGISPADFQDFVAETGSYLIPSILSGGTSLLGRLGLGALTYGAAEGVRQVATGLFGGKGQTDKEMISRYLGPIDCADWWDYRSNFAAYLQNRRQGTAEVMGPRQTESSGAERGHQRCVIWR